MVAFNTVKAGDTLHDCRMQKQGNTTLRKMTCWDVQVIEVDAENNRVKASWNGNTPKWMYRREIEKLRRTPYKPRAPKV